MDNDEMIRKVPRKMSLLEEYLGWLKVGHGDNGSLECQEYPPLITERKIKWVSIRLLLFREHVRYTQGIYLNFEIT